jgi:GTP-binding protein Era
MTEEFRSGFAALVGRPNVGKSTLLNAMVGQKVSIVTPRPQTTRHRIVGIAHLPNAQIAFVDTPGLHQHGSRALNKAMNRTAATSLNDADLVVLVIDATKWTAEDDLALERVVASGLPAIAAVNKIDQIHPRDKLLPYMADLAKRHNFAAIVPISALKANGVEALKTTIAESLPVAPAMYADDQLTESSLEFRIAEMIREKLTLELNQEVPYGVAVEVEQMKDAEDGQLTVDAAIWVDREGQKPIVIGAKGERLKRVGRSARIALNDLLNRRLHLNLWVKVRENWADNARALKHLGLE